MKTINPFYYGGNTLFKFSFHDEESRQKSYNEYINCLAKMSRKGVCEQIFVNNAYAFSFRKIRRVS